MPANRKILMLPGDGVGPEVMAEVRRVIDWQARHRSVGFDISEGLVGGCSYNACGQAISDETMTDAMHADAVLMGAVGGPEWDGKVPRHCRPEAGLLRLRKDMALYANLRPARVFDALAEASSLKKERVLSLDMLIVRELTGGVYFGEPKEITTFPDGTRRAVDTQLYTSPEIERIAIVAFELARKRSGKVHSAEKMNVMETGVLWREVVTEVHRSGGFEDIELHHILADNCAMQLVRQPRQFDVLVTDNLFGDILSDCAAMLTGSLGMLPSASLGAMDGNGTRKALYEPVHGSAPDIAGKGLANPLAMILSYAMCLRYSFDGKEDADMIEGAVGRVLANGLRTSDIMAKGCTWVSTEEMGKAVIAEMDKAI